MGHCKADNRQDQQFGDERASTNAAGSAASGGDVSLDSSVAATDSHEGSTLARKPPRRLPGQKKQRNAPKRLSRLEEYSQARVTQNPDSWEADIFFLSRILDAWQRCAKAEIGVAAAPT